MTELSEPLLRSLREIVSFTSQLRAVLPKVAAAAHTAILRQHFLREYHRLGAAEERLQRIQNIIPASLEGKTCRATQALLSAAQVETSLRGTNPAIADAKLLGTCEDVLVHGLSCYARAWTIAEELGDNEVASILRAALEEESRTFDFVREIVSGELIENPRRSRRTHSEDDLFAS